jgi:hypothetical protein
MTISKHTILLLIDRVSSVLNQPLSALEIQSGWTTEAQSAFLKLIAELRAKVENDAIIPNLSLSRGLDSWGVTGGQLVEIAAELSNSLRDYSRSKVS